MLWKEARKNLNQRIPKNSDKITAFDGPLGTVLVFPDKVKYKLNEYNMENVTAILEKHLTSFHQTAEPLPTDDNDQSSPPPTTSDNETKTSSTLLLIGEKLHEDYIFVCSHAQRDRRCGYVGPILLEKLKEELSRRNASRFAFRVHGCSHIGGHKYAGNVLCFVPRPGAPLANEQPSMPHSQSSGSSSRVMGDWYGYVTPEDVSDLVGAMINGTVVIPKWRGCMGVDRQTAASMIEAWSNLDQVVSSSTASDESVPTSGPSGNKCDHCDCMKN